MSDRKTSFKTPPIAERELSQDARRARALEAQKKKRLQRVDSARNLDLFAGLTLGGSDDENDEGTRGNTPDIAHEGVARFASMMRSDASQAPTSAGGKGGKGKGRWKGKQKKINSKYADVCMYAELFNMREPDAWSSSLTGDGLPEDLDAWVAVAPVPMGKRCLAVANQSSGVSGTVPNTILRSRVLGKRLLPPFPSPLPASTVLDCILDPNWQENGIIHVLDVIRWKEQDIGDGETPFRFWWRDTRLSELLPLPIPTSATAPQEEPLTEEEAPGPRGEPSYEPMDQPPKGPYKFPYPYRFLPIPYHTDTTLPSLLSSIIPLSRTSRTFQIDVPSHDEPVPPPLSPGVVGASPSVDAMDMDMADDAVGGKFGIRSMIQREVTIHSDGLLLYVAEASYEPGTSPLSAWVPIVSYEPPPAASTSTSPRNHPLQDTSVQVPSEGPLDTFERLLSRRLHLLSAHASPSSGVDASMLS